MNQYPHLYRDNKKLVFRKGVNWPQLCIKTNKEISSNEGLHKRIYWHSQAIYLTAFISPLIYIIVAMITRKEYFGFFPMSQETIKKRKIEILISVLLSLLGLILFFASIGAADNESLILIMMPLGFFLMLGALIYGTAKRLITPVKISNEFVWITGVHKDFLQQLPQWDPKYEYGFPDARIFE